MTDEELDALVKQAMDRAIERLQKLHSHAGRPAWDQVICEELSGPITTLRAQLAEARAERDDEELDARQLPSGWADVMSSAIQRFEVAAAINGSAVWNSVGSKAMAELLKELSNHVDRAEAALATVFGDGLRTAISVIASIGYGKNEDVDAGHEEAFRAVEKYLTDWTSRGQPHDRTALERMLAEAREQTALGMVDVMATTAKEAREKALREAAEILDDEGWLGMSMHRILALIEKEKTE
jgi:hypothetical protein